MDFELFTPPSDYRGFRVKMYLHENGHSLKAACRLLGGSRAERYVTSLLYDAEMMVDLCPKVWRALGQLSQQLTEHITTTGIDDSYPEIMEVSERLHHFLRSVETGPSANRNDQ